MTVFPRNADCWRSNAELNRRAQGSPADRDRRATPRRAPIAGGLIWLGRTPVRRDHRFYGKHGDRLETR
jgi:hypothetical protein